MIACVDVRFGDDQSGGKIRSKQMFSKPENLASCVKTSCVWFFSAFVTSPQDKWLRTRCILPMSSRRFVWEENGNSTQ